EQLSSAEATARELEARLSQHVPQNVYDELVSKIVSLAEDVTGGALTPEGAEAAAQAEAVEGASTDQAEQVTEETSEAPQQGMIPETVEFVATARGSAENVQTNNENSVPEIREIQSQLAEITSQAKEAAQVNTESSSGEATPAGSSNEDVVVATVPEASKTTIGQTVD
ncbi:MAG: hypothetical protein HYU03_04430, partial [Thaumarchaeota archaeon]|nr:hypothetical protein [Nitrososphaerota archaeon]